MTKYKLHLTLNSALKHNPCQDGLDKFIEYLDKNNIGPYEPVNLLRVLENNGVDHAIWALRACLEKNLSRKVAEAIVFVCGHRPTVYPDDSHPDVAVYNSVYYSIDAAVAAEREKQNKCLLALIEDD